MSDEKINHMEFVNDEDLQRMIQALQKFRAYEWWFKTENPSPEGRCLSPLVLQNMAMGYENGSIMPTMTQFKNLLNTAIFYQQKCRTMSEKGPNAPNKTGE